MSRTFTYRFEDGTSIYVESLTSEGLALLEQQFGKCTYNGWAEFMGVGQPSRLGVIGGVHTRGDGFKSGWHPGLGMHIGGPEHYSRVLKEKGMVEVGNEKTKASGAKTKSYINEEVIKDAVAQGAEISDAAAEVLMSGKSLAEEAAKPIEVNTKVVE